MRSLTASLIMLLMGACAGAESTGAALAAGTEALVIRTGTSFGMCVGYCATELRIDRRAMVLTETSREPDRYPPRTRRAAIGEQEWAELVALVDGRAFSGLLDVYGCPDCADGGAEWVELIRDGRAKRVVFEHGAPMPSLEPLLAELREIRARMLARP